MRITLQIHTGGFKMATTSTEQIINKLNEISQYFDVHSLIYGWSKSNIDFSQIKDYCGQKHIDVYAWLPVLSELEGELQLQPFIDSWGQILKPYTLSESEHFTFCCPQDPNNKLLINKYLSEAFPYEHFDGVFFDRMRYPSAIHGTQVATGCHCSFCQSQENSNFRTTPQYKSDIILSTMLPIVEHFKNMGLKIGFDLFAMPFNTSVGQDYDLLAPLCDFFKPMYYTSTHAPAGMPFEAKALSYSPQEWAYYTTIDHYAQLASQYGSKIRLGIEWNVIDPIVAVAPQMLSEHLTRAALAGIEHVVLSWQALSAPRANILAVSQFENNRL